jgi:hypothetical protein
MNLNVRVFSRSTNSAKSPSRGLRHGMGFLQFCFTSTAEEKKFHTEKKQQRQQNPKADGEERQENQLCVQ